jgi:hypothetical protein
LVLAAVYIDTDANPGGITVGTGWTEDTEQLGTGGNWGKFQAQRRTGSTSTSVTWDDVKPDTVALYAHASAAVEIIAAGGAPAEERYGPHLFVPSAAAVRAVTW